VIFEGEHQTGLHSTLLALNNSVYQKDTSFYNQASNYGQQVCVKLT